MRTVHVGIGHDDNLVVSELFDIELSADTAAECRYHILYFFGV